MLNRKNALPVMGDSSVMGFSCALHRQFRRRQHFRRRGLWKRLRLGYGLLRNWFLDSRSSFSLDTGSFEEGFGNIQQKFFDGGSRRRSSCRRLRSLRRWLDDFGRRTLRRRRGRHAYTPAIFQSSFSVAGRFFLVSGFLINFAQGLADAGSIGVTVSAHVE